MVPLPNHNTGQDFALVMAGSSITSGVIMYIFIAAIERTSSGKYIMESTNIAETIINMKP